MTARCAHGVLWYRQDCLTCYPPESAPLNPTSFVFWSELDRDDTAKFAMVKRLMDNAFKEWGW